MKVFVLAGCLFAVFVSINCKEEMEEELIVCAKEGGISNPEDTLEDLFMNKDKSIDCIMACYMKKKGVLENNAFIMDRLTDISVDHITKKFGKEKSAIEKRVVECSEIAVTKPDDCSMAASIAACLMDVDKY